jgi:DNA-directed RNA polymerase subunit M/transcription elongation factor TFIIS
MGDLARAFAHAEPPPARAEHVLALAALLEGAGVRPPEGAAPWAAAHEAALFLLTLREVGRWTVPSLIALCVTYRELLGTAAALIGAGVLPLIEWYECGGAGARARTGAGAEARRARSALSAEARALEALAHAGPGAPLARARCFRCASSAVSLVEMQARSADEGGTPFYTCHGCGAARRADA